MAGPYPSGVRPQTRREKTWLERREEVDGLAVGVEHLRVAVTPEGVPRRELRRAAGTERGLVRRVDVGRRVAREGEREVVARGPLPRRVDLLDQLLRVPHQPQTVRQRRLEMVVAGGLAGVYADRAVERHGARDVGGDDPDCVEAARHAPSLIPSDQRTKVLRPMTVTSDVIPENTIRVLDHGFVRLDGCHGRRSLRRQRRARLVRAAPRRDDRRGGRA